MKVPQLTRVLLRLHLTLRRSSVGVLLAAAFALGAASMWFALLPGMAARIVDEARAVARARSAPLPKPVVSPATLAAERLNAFYAVLGDAAHTEQVVMRLFDAAAEAGIKLDKTEYKPAVDRTGRFETYTIVLPVKGDYASLRRFCEKVLLKVPYAALDDMRFKRSSANDQTVEASLRFTVFLRPAAPAAAVEVARAASAASVAGAASGVSAVSAVSAASAVSAVSGVSGVSGVSTASTANAANAVSAASAVSAVSVASAASGTSNASGASAASATSAVSATNATSTKSTTTVSAADKGRR